MTIYPTKNAIEKADKVQICYWYRFLPSPENDEQAELLDYIVERFKKFGGFTPKISKMIGWERR